MLRRLLLINLTLVGIAYLWMERVMEANNQYQLHPMPPLTMEQVGALWDCAVHEKPYPPGCPALNEFQMRHLIELLDLQYQERKLVGTH
jgi:hypothetical protein